MQGYHVPTEQQRCSKCIKESISEILRSYEFLIEVILWNLKVQTSNAEVMSPLHLYKVYLPLVAADSLCNQHLPRTSYVLILCILLLVQLTWHSHAKLQFKSKLPWYTWGNGEGRNIHRLEALDCAMNGQKYIQKVLSRVLGKKANKQLESVFLVYYGKPERGIPASAIINKSPTARRY